MRKETGIGLIASERQRQIMEEGWDEDHDNSHDAGELAVMGALYAVDGLKSIMVIQEAHKTIKNQSFGQDELFTGRDAYPDDWSGHWDKRGNDSRLRRLAKAGALIAAEIDRLLRKNSTGRNQ